MANKKNNFYMSSNVILTPAFICNYFVKPHC